MGFDLGCPYGVVTSGLDDLLVCAPDIAVFPECPGPTLEVDGLVMYGVGDCYGGFVVDSSVDRIRCQSSKESSCDFRSS